jgi:serine/threonine-protein kinase RsbW
MMVIETKKLEVSAMRDEVRNVCAFVERIAEKAGMGADGIFQCQLCVEEVFTNVVEHGYGNQPTNEQVEIICTYTDTLFAIEVLDKTPPFNPLASETPDPQKTLWEREGGGWGVYFVRQYMHKVQYSYRNDKNCLRMERHIP